MDAQLEQLINSLDEYEIDQAFRSLFHRLLVEPTAGHGINKSDLAAEESEAVDAISREYPEVADALAAFQNAQDPWSRSRIYRAFLLSYAEATTNPSDSEALMQALKYAKESPVETAGLELALLGLAIVMVLQLNFDVQYENKDGKKRLKVAVSKKPSSSSIIKKILSPLS